jgi:hypothetical protein
MSFDSTTAVIAGKVTGGLVWLGLVEFKQVEKRTRQNQPIAARSNRPGTKT